MKKKLEKQLRSFIDFDYSKRTIDRFHRWLISSDSAEEKETAPVSYTHLDVYKRQDLNSPETKNFRSISCAMAQK